MNYIKPSFIKLNIPDLINASQKLAPIGYLSKTNNQLIYLNIDDHYIHQLFPLIKRYDNTIEKPDYFGVNSAGAHISVIYPEEKSNLTINELGQKYTFTITDAASAILEHKKYYVLLAQCEPLITLRNKYGLGNKLIFKNYLIDLHITIGTTLF